MPIQSSLSPALPGNPSWSWVWDGAKWVQRFNSNGSPLMGARSPGPAPTTPGKSIGEVFGSGGYQTTPRVIPPETMQQIERLKGLPNQLPNIPNMISQARLAQPTPIPNAMMSDTGYMPMTQMGGLTPSIKPVRKKFGGNTGLRFMSI